MIEPNFIIIGAQRCGTTSLWQYLQNHPQINVPKKKELHYFDHRFFTKEYEWYLSHFKGCEGVTGEASPFYVFNPHSPRRIVNKYSEIKLIVLLRNPVDRAYSHYNHEINCIPRERREFESFPEAIELEESRISGEFDRIVQNERYRSDKILHFAYKKRGLYAEQLKRWFEFFSDNLLIIQSECLYNNYKRNFVLSRVFDFLGVGNIEVKSDYVGNKLNYGSMSNALKNKLTRYFEPHNRELKELLKDKNFIITKESWIK